MAYGLEITGINGSTVVFGPDYKVCNLAVYATQSFSPNTPVTFTCDSANDSSKVVITVNSTFSTWTISTTATNFSVTNTHTSSRTATVIAWRIK